MTNGSEMTRCSTVTGADRPDLGGRRRLLITGTKHLNKMNDLTTDAYLREVLMPQVDGMKCYKREITPKGMQRIERAVKAEAAMVAAGEAETVKAPKVKAAAKKRTSKPHKPKATADKLPTISPVKTEADTLIAEGRALVSAALADTSGDENQPHVTDLPENQL